MRLRSLSMAVAVGSVLLLPSGALAHHCDQTPSNSGGVDVCYGMRICQNGPGAGAHARVRITSLEGERWVDSGPQEVSVYGCR